MCIYPLLLVVLLRTVRWHLQFQSCLQHRHLGQLSDFQISQKDPLCVQISCILYSYKWIEQPSFSNCLHHEQSRTSFTFGMTCCCLRSQSYSHRRDLVFQASQFVLLPRQKLRCGIRLGIDKIIAERVHGLKKKSKGSFLVHFPPNKIKLFLFLKKKVFVSYIL